MKQLVVEPSVLVALIGLFVAAIGVALLPTAWAVPAAIVVVGAGLLVYALFLIPEKTP